MIAEPTSESAAPGNSARLNRDSMARRNNSGQGMGLATAVILFLFVVLPTGWPVFRSAYNVQTWTNLAAESGRLIDLLWMTLKVAGCTLAVVIPLSLSLALMLFRLQLPGRKLVLLIVIATSFLPLVFHAGGFRGSIGPDGFLWWFADENSESSRFAATLIVHSSLAIPWLTLIFGAALGRVPHSVEDAARLELSAGSTLLRVSVPLIAPAIAFGALLAVAPVFTDMTATDLFRLRTFAEEAYTETQLSAGEGSSSGSPVVTLASLMLSLTLAVGIAFSLRPLIQTRLTATAKARRFAADRSTFGIVIVGLAALLLLCLPIAGAFWQLGLTSTSVANEGVGTEHWSPAAAFDVFWRTLVSSMDSVFNSLVIAFLGSVLGVILAAIVAWYSLFASAKWRLLALIGTIWLFVIPGPVLGTSVLELLYRNLFAEFPVALAEGRTIVVYAVSLRLLPIALVVFAGALARSDPRLFELAALEGAGPWRLLFAMALPTVWTAVVFAFLIGAAQGYSELAVTQIVVPPGLDLLGPWIFHLLHIGTSSQQAALCVIVFGLSLSIALAMAWVFRASSR